MATTQERVRRLLAEVIPTGGTDADTLFTNVAIDDLLTENGGDVELAAAQGWREKSAMLAELVDTAEGTSKRAMSDLHKNALAMVEMYSGRSGTTAARTRSLPIERS